MIFPDDPSRFADAEIAPENRVFGFFRRIFRVS